MLLGMVSLTACQQLQHGQMQPVKAVDVKNGIYLTTCSGAVEDMSTCSAKASDTCKKGYEVITRSESPAQGARRELSFQCKK